MTPRYSWTILLLCCWQLWAIGRFLPPVGPKVEYGNERMRLHPKTIRRTPAHITTPVIPAMAKVLPTNPVDANEFASASHESVYATSSEPLLNIPVKPPVNVIRRERTDKIIMERKVQTTLLYKPKFPAHPNFNMCRLHDFDIANGGKLGKGGFGSVFMGRHRATNTPVAIKIISSESIQKNPKHVEFEEIIHGRLYNPWIARFFCTMADTETSDIYFVLEYVPGNNLAKQISLSHPLPFKKIQLWTAEIIFALEYLHDQCIVYRDMKAENVIIAENGHVKLVDFGLSVFDCNDELKSVAGTLEYTAPEMAARKPHGRAVDFFGLGVLLYTMRTGRLPLSFKASGMDKKGFLNHLATDFTIPTTTDPVVDDLIRHLCDRHVNSRWGLTAESRILLRDHQFFSGLDWSTLEDQLKKTRQYEPLIPLNDFKDENFAPLDIAINPETLNKK